MLPIMLKFLADAVLEAADRICIGLKRLSNGSSDWEWVNGRPYTHRNDDWSLGEPNNSNGGEDCVVLPKIEGSWNDNDCDKLLSALRLVCQYPKCRSKTVHARGN